VARFAFVWARCYSQVSMARTDRPCGPAVIDVSSEETGWPDGRVEFPCPSTLSAFFSTSSAADNDAPMQSDWLSMGDYDSTHVYKLRQTIIRDLYVLPNIGAVD